MKTNQRIRNRIWSAVAVATLLFIKASVGQAGILEGHFKRDDLHAFVKVTNGNAFGLIWNDDGKSSQISLYRIEEQDDDSQAWIKLSVNDAQMIGSNASAEADFTGSIIQRDKRYLSLSPTEFGRQNGNASRLVLKESDTYSWLDLPDTAIVYHAEGDSRVERRSNTISKKQVQGTFTVATQTYSGNYVVRNTIPQVGTLHSIELSSENESGRRISRKIVSFVVRIKGSCFLDSNEYAVFFNLSKPGKIEFNKVIH